MKLSAEGMKRMKAQWMEDEEQADILLEKHESIPRSGSYALTANVTSYASY